MSNDLGSSYGGAVYIHVATPSVVIRGCTFQNNQILAEGTPSTALGGAVYVEKTSLSVYSTNFIDNAITFTSSSATSPSVGGGAFYFYGTSSSLQYEADFSTCLFSRNTVLSSASSASGVVVAKGGAILTGAYNTTITLCSFYQNNVSTDTQTSRLGYAAGGGIYNSDFMSLTIQSSLFSQNSVKSARNSYGGALCWYSGKGWLAIHNASFSRNTILANGTTAYAAAGGAAYVSTSSGVGITTITDTTFSQNQAVLAQTTYVGTAQACKDPLELPALVPTLPAD